jgi:hypothetical protein
MSMSDPTVAAVAVAGGPAQAGGRYRRLARRVHALVGWGAVSMALGHLVTVSLLGRGRDGKWLALELVIGAAVLVPGWWMVRSATAIKRGGGVLSAVCATAVLGGVSLWQMVTWRATFPAVFALTAAVDGFALGFLPRRWWWKVLVLLVFVALGALSVVTYGDSPIPFEP